MKRDLSVLNNIKHIDYKDVEFLKTFLNPNGRILPKRKTGMSAKNQRKLALAVKRARIMALIPFINE